MSEAPAILNTHSIADVRTSLRSKLAAAMSDSLVRKGMLSVFDQAIVSGTSFVTSVLIGRLCSPHDLGVYYLALSIVLFVRGIQEQIISAPFTVYCHRKEGNQLASYTGSTLIHQFLLLAITAGGLAVIVSVGFGSTQLPTAAWALVAAAPLILFREFLRQLVFGRLALRTAILLDVCVAVVQLGGLAVLVWYDQLTVANAYLVMGAACAVAALGWWFLKSDPVAFQTRQILPDWKRNWAFSKWALASHLVGNSAPYVLPWFVAAVDGTAATGLLAACTTLVGLANAFVMGVCNFLTPKSAQSYASGGLPELRAVLKKSAILFSAVLGCIALVATIFGEQIAVIVYGDEYAGAGPLMAVLAFALLIGSLGRTAGNGLWAMERPSANFRADLFAFVAAVVAAVVLTPPYGALGAALSTLIAVVVDVIARGWILHRTMREVAVERPQNTDRTELV